MFSFKSSCLILIIISLCNPSSSYILKKNNSIVENNNSKNLNQFQKVTFRLSFFNNTCSNLINSSDTDILCSNKSHFEKCCQNEFLRQNFDINFINQSTGCYELNNSTKSVKFDCILYKEDTSNNLSVEIISLFIIALFAIMLIWFMILQLKKCYRRNTYDELGDGYFS